MSRNARSRMGRAIKAAPSFSLDFTKGVLDPRLTFTRASGGTYIDSTGVMQTAASNAPRFDYDPVTLAIRGLLIEEARTNLVPVSRTGWGSAGATVTLSSAIGTDGVASTAAILAEVASSSQQTASNGSIAFTSGVVYTISALMKPGTLSRCQLTAGAVAFGTGQYANFSLTGAGSVLASAGVVSSGIRPAGNGFYHCWIVATATATASGGVVVNSINSDTATRSPIYAGNNASTLIVDHAQAEAGAFPTSIIPTSGAATTRAAEQCNAALGPWFNPSEGCVAVDMLTGPDGVESRFLAFDDGSATNRLVFQRINTNLLSGFGAGFASGWGLNTTGIGVRSGQGARHVVCGSYGTRTTSRLSSDGVLGNASAQVITSPGTMLTRMTVGHNIGSTQHNGHIRAVDYYPVALDPQTLRRLTSATESPSPRRINPDCSLHFLDGVLDSRVTFTRASSGTRINSAGVLVTETTNAPRFDYDPVTLACKGLLIEEARTNVVSSSSNSSTFSKVDVTTVQNVTGVDGVANSASTCTEGTAGSATCAPGSITAVAAGAQITGTVVLKRGNTDWARIILSDNSLVDGGNFWVNLATGQNGIFSARGAGTLLNISIKPMGGGWYACSPTVKPNASYTIPQVVVVSAAGDGNGARVNGATYLLHHFQVEAGSSPTSIIPTTGAAATRAGDTVLVTGASFSSVYNATQGTLAAEFIRTNGDSGSGSPGIFQADDGSSNNRVALRLNSRLANAASQGTVVVGGAVITNTGSVSSAIQGGVIRATMSYSAAGGNTNVAGGTPSPYTLTALPTACTQFAIGGGGGSLGATALSGHIRHIDYYRQALPADFITELSR